MDELEKRIQSYWTKRTRDFGTVRRNELNDGISARWLSEMEKHLPRRSPLDILDVGTGTGYFAILLAEKGHVLTGIDLTASMLGEAEKAAADSGVSITFIQEDAQDTHFEDESFDAIVMRNLTWTLPEPEKAYREWYRLLRRGGVLLNFDADYASNVRNRNQKASYISLSGVYGHTGITPELSKENDEITLSMPASMQRRPQWDLELLKAAGFTNCGADESVGERILMERDLPDAPMFLIFAGK